ncbi:hypothetical protein GCM10010468_45730 [Actinocorallia longicatena]|uniref:Uncharacterized protein n=1 Tax=Actinocorallia longicatena TaxID=111803 RepID=A0ABP6QD01_9ACTN
MGRPAAVSRGALHRHDAQKGIGGHGGERREMKLTVTDDMGGRAAQPDVQRTTRRRK